MGDIHQRIRFFQVTEPSTLLGFLQEYLRINKTRAEFLVHLGAIYHTQTPPHFERVIEDILLAPGDFLRCHTDPRRFPILFQWDQLILFENEEFLLLDKPHGIPCQASLDNRIENLHHQLSQHLKQNLLITHRLDIGTRGLIILAKNKTFQRYFNQLLEQRKVMKIYEAQTTGPLLPPQSLTHWMLFHPRAPKVLTIHPEERSKICELSLLQSKQVCDQNKFKMSVFQNKDLVQLNQYRLQLHTGRTHQIRAQLAFMQNPIWGDTLYGGVPRPIPFSCLENRENLSTSEYYSLQCLELRFHYPLQDSQIFHWKIDSPSIF